MPAGPTRCGCGRRAGSATADHPRARQRTAGRRSQPLAWDAWPTSRAHANGRRGTVARAAHRLPWPPRVPGDSVLSRGLPMRQVRPWFSRGSRTAPRGRAATAPAATRRQRSLPQPKPSRAAGWAQRRGRCPRRCGDCSLRPAHRQPNPARGLPRASGPAWSRTRPRPHSWAGLPGSVGGAGGPRTVPAAPSSARVGATSAAGRRPVADLSSTAVARAARRHRIAALRRGRLGHSVVVWAARLGTGPPRVITWPCSWRISPCLSPCLWRSAGVRRCRRARGRAWARCPGRRGVWGP